MELELSNARNPRQIAKMRECLSLGRCPFCEDYFYLYHDAPVRKSGNYWIITANDDPYPGSTHHYLAIAKGRGTSVVQTKHITNLSEVHPCAWAELFQLFSELAKELGVPGAGVFLRFGDMKYTGATIAHLHAHFIVGTEKTEGCEWLQVTLGYMQK